MQIEKQVTSLKLSKKLKELSVKQESYFYWIRRGRPFKTVGAKVTYMLLAPIVAQERPNRPGDDGESESGSTVPDVGRVSVAERSARGQEPSGVSVLPRGLGRWAAPSTTRSRPHNDHSAASRHSSFCVH